MELQPVTRGSVLMALKQRAGSALWVSDTVKVGVLRRSYDQAKPEDRFTSMCCYPSGEKHDAAIGWAAFFLIEFDDLAVKETAEWLGLDAVAGMAPGYVTRSMLALEAFLRKPPCPPFLVVYSGGKSFHCLWQFSRRIEGASLRLLRESRDVLKNTLKKAVGNLKDSHRAFLDADLQAMFSSIAMARIPCEVVEPGRFPQVGWRTGSPGTIDADELLEVADYRLREAQMVSRVERLPWGYIKPSRTGDIPTFSAEALEPVLGKLTPRNGGGWYCKCPQHGDSNASAFVTEKGFIYCSVCCDSSKQWVSRVNAGGRLVDNDK